MVYEHVIKQLSDNKKDREQVILLATCIISDLEEDNSEDNIKKAKYLLTSLSCVIKNNEEQSDFLRDIADQIIKAMPKNTK